MIYFIKFGQKRHDIIAKLHIFSKTTTFNQSNKHNYRLFLEQKIGSKRNNE